MYSKAGLPAAPHQGLGPALEYERVRFEEASDALEDDHRLPTPQNSCPPIAEQPLWWIYCHPGEAKYTMILIYPAAHQDSSPVSGRGALFVLFCPRVYYRSAGTRYPARKEREAKSSPE